MAQIDLTRFFDALQRAYPEESRASVARVLVIGPSYAAAMIDLLALFPEAHLTLIDADQQVIEQITPELSEYTDRVRLEAGNAVQLPELAPGPYDLAIIRHPDVSRRPDTWGQVITASAGELAPGGTMIFTAYSLPEASFIDQVLQTLSLPMRDGSPYSPVPVALQGNDRYILIYDRPV